MFIFCKFEKYRTKLFYKYYSIDNYFKQIAETNIMNIRFFVKNKNQLYITITGIRKYKQLALYTQINIEKQYFDVSKQAIRKNHNNHFKLNSFLSDYKTKIENWFLEFLDVHPKFEYDYFTAELKNFLSNADDKSFFSVYDDYVSYKKNIVASSTLQNYNSLRYHLFEFQKATKYILNFDTINFDFFSKFQVFCINQKLTNNYIKKLIKTLSAFMNFSSELNLCKNDNYKKFSGKIKVDDPTTFTITYEEFEIIKNSNLTNKTLEKVRDVFVFLCLSGFDIKQIRNIKEEFIEKIPNSKFYNVKIFRKKTNKLIKEARLHEIAYKILVRYNYFQDFMSDQRLNIYLKEVAKELQLNRNLMTIKTIGNETTTEVRKVHELISSHWGRKFYVTYLKSNNVSNDIISQNTGHTSDKMINYYDKRSQTQKDISVLEKLELFQN